MGTHTDDAETYEGDRRHTTRSPFATRVAVKTDKAIYFMESQNISAGGALLESEIRIPAGTRCQIVPFVEECANIFEAGGTVIRTEQQGQRFGMGVRFDTLADADLQILEGIVQEWQTRSA